MSAPPLPLTALSWTPDLAVALADASAAIARLDARICASSLAPAWTLRASWTGYAAALRLQAFEIDEIDIISHACGLTLPGRALLETASDPFAALAPWQARLVEKKGRHWREDLPFTFELPEAWDKAPALARALALVDAWARHDRTMAPWLGLPTVLRRMGITVAPLPCLVVGDAGQRLASDLRPALLKRLLKQFTRSADHGLVVVDRLERYVQRGAAALSLERRPGKLADLVRLSLAHPLLAGRNVAAQLGLTISGAGKLLERASSLGMLVEVSGRTTWRAYVSADLAVTLGLVAPVRGRPRLAATDAKPVREILASFDDEMHAISAKLTKLEIAPMFEIDEFRA
ncbi:hypothetical protein SAMN06272759_1423 [Novosphingobium sp. B1]|nr:hypothetical protein SAMN06272759_1423 [Novosphingobium sp. B1]